MWQTKCDCGTPICPSIPGTRDNWTSSHGARWSHTLSVETQLFSPHCIEMEPCMHSRPTSSLKFLESDGARGNNVPGVGTTEPIRETHGPGVRNGGLMASQSPHDGFEAHRGQGADDSPVATASNSTGVSSTMVGNPLDGAPTHKCYESLGSSW